MNSRNAVVNLQPGTSIPVIRVSQYDVGVTLSFVVYDGNEPASFASGTTATIQATRPSGTGFVQNCTLSGNVVTVDTVIAMTQEYGRMQAELRFTNGSTDVGTGNIVYIVEKAAHPDEVIDADVNQWTELAQQVHADTVQSTQNATTANEAKTSAQNAADTAIRNADIAVKAAASVGQASDAAVSAKEAAEAAANTAETTVANTVRFDISQTKTDAQKLQARNNTGSAGVTSLAPAYSASSTYSVGDMITRNGKLYKCSTAIETAEAWTASHWTEVAVGNEITNLKDDLDKLNEGGLVLKDDVIAGDVQDWLEEHPEATTTVENGSITIDKLNQSVRVKVEVITKNETVSPIYIGDFLSGFDYLPSAVVKVSNLFYVFDPHTADYNVLHNQDYGNVRIFDIVENKELENSPIQCRLGHANSVCYNPDEGIFYVSPSDIYENGKIIPVKKLYKYDSSFDSMTEEITPTYPKGVTFDHIDRVMYYCDRENNVYKKENGEWIYFCKINLSGIVESVGQNNRTYNQDFSVYNKQFYLSSPYGSVLFGVLQNDESIPIKHYGLTNEDEANTYRIGELEGFEFDELGHLYAAQYTTLSGDARNGFVTELPITNAFASSSQEGSLFTVHMGSIALSQTSQTRFSLNRGEIRSLLQNRLLRHKLVRVVIDSNQSIIEQYPIIVDTNIEILLTGSLTVPCFYVWGGKLSITAKGNNQLICSGDSAIFKVDRNGSLQLQGETLNVDIGSVQEGNRNFIDVGDSACVIAITSTLNSLAERTLYIGDRYAIKNFIYRSSYLRFINTKQYIVNKNSCFFGHVTNNGKDIVCTIQLSGEYSSELLLSQISGTICIRGIQGYVVSSNGIDLSDYNVSTIFSINLLTLVIKSETGYENAVNNTPVSIQATSPLTLTFAHV